MLKAFQSSDCWDDWKLNLGASQHLVLDLEAIVELGMTGTVWGHRYYVCALGHMETCLGHWGEGIGVFE